MRTADWLLIDEALETMLAAIEPCAAETVALDQAHGRTLAEPVISPIDQPPWDNSAMDGFAVLAADVRGATASAPVVLDVIEDVPAGALPQLPLSPGKATRIMTGAPIPPGADSVVRVEHTRPRADGRVDVIDDVDAGRNIRPRGEDVRAGARVLAAGRLLRPAEVGVLAMIGCTQPRVTIRPRVAVLATGNELVEPDRIDAVASDARNLGRAASGRPRSGAEAHPRRSATHIINSNTPAICAGLRDTGCEPLALGIARDDLDDLRARLHTALDADALITTAGASVGEHDLVKDALEELGCRVLFWRVKIRPGSPFSFGLVPRAGRSALPVFGLPGNPVSALVTFEILVRPALRRMLGRTALYAVTLAALAGEDMRSPPGLMRFLRVRLEHRAGAAPLAYLTGPQGSGILTSVAAADGLLVVPLEQERVSEGDPVCVVSLSAFDSAQDVPGF